MNIENRREYQRLYCRRHRAEHREKYREAYLRWRHRQDKPCPICGKVMFYTSTTCQACYFEKLRTRSPERNSNWKGGRYNDKGRVCLYIPSHPSSRKGGYILRARLVMEEQIGRPLKLEEIVHHLNGIRDDDRPQNLVIASRKTHEKHTLERLLQKRIRELEAKLAQHPLPLERQF